MKLPRDVSGRDMAKALSKLGYTIDRQDGSHIRLTTSKPTEHHITIPDHNPIKIGTLNSILRDVGAHAKLDRQPLLELLFG
jgi:predicted RNA binding protein YcfA (HicA-like mRNA interferase family)